VAACSTNSGISADAAQTLAWLSASTEAEGRRRDASDEKKVLDHAQRRWRCALQVHPEAG
jgi:hypothetical protein